MIVLQIITLSELGGAQSVVINLANKLSDNNEVIVAAGEGDGKMFDLLSPRIKKEHIPSLVRRLSPLNELKAIMEMKKLYCKYNPDIIHLHSSKAGLLGRFAFPKSKIVYTVHGFDSIRLAYRKFLPLEKMLQRRCAAIVGVSKYDELNLITEGIHNNVSTVYNGIFQPAKLNKDPFANRCGYRGKILCIARLSPQKNHRLFIDVARKMPDVAFIWIGNLNKPNFDFPKNVFFLGNIKGAGSYTAFADVFMLPSNYEGLPIVIIEALSNGIPVVASNVGGITELLNGDNGFAVDNNASLMAEKIDVLLSVTPQKRKQISDAALNTYMKNFTVDKMAKGYLSLYNQIYK